MSTLGLVVVTALVLAAAVYAQMQIPRFVANPRTALLTRAGLIVLGLIFGYVAADNFVAAEGPGLLTFFAGFGAVHVPAAFILFFKRMGGAGKS